MKKVIVAGASGVVGLAAVRQFQARGDCEVIATARRKPHDLVGATFLAADLTDQAACADLFGSIRDVTHVVYAALQEQPQLISGWQETEQIETNGRMLENFLSPLLRASPGLRHVTLLQGTKAYGIHRRAMNIPAREGVSEAREFPNFYWLQEDYLHDAQRRGDWSWTILRPQIIFGQSFGSAMNLIPAIGVYAALMREKGKLLPYPGGVTNILEAVDADLLGEAIVWCGEADKARNEVYNVTNGDVFVWENVWPGICQMFGMIPGAVASVSLAAEMPGQAAAWDLIRQKYGLVSPGLDQFVGKSFQYADYCFGYGCKEPSPHSVVSTVKIRRAGFDKYICTEEMFGKWFTLFQQQRWLPTPH